MRDLKRCVKLSPDNCVTMPGINEPKVGLCGEPTLSKDGLQDINAEDKDHLVTEYPDLSKDANLPLRRVEEAKQLVYFCSVLLNRLLIVFCKFLVAS